MIHQRLFNVYNSIPIELIKGYGSYLFDKNGQRYLDFYGGHAVISIGHLHSHYVKALKAQINQITFYSNYVHIPNQERLSELLCKVSGYEDYKLFLCNSGTESIENALKIASFHNRKKKIIAFKGSFHGRTSGSASITDNTKILAPFNSKHEVLFLNYKDLLSVEKELRKRNVCALITEGIQGISGIIDPGDFFLREVQNLCRHYETVFILDEIQSGYGRTGDFFAHQRSGVTPDLISLAKGMGNGFPIGGVLIHPKFEEFNGMLGSTFGGNYLACVAAISVLEVIKNENLLKNVKIIGEELLKHLLDIPHIEEIRGRGFMIGLRFNFPVKKLIEVLINKEKVFVGFSYDPYVLRLFPPLNITKDHVKLFIKKLVRSLES